MTGSRWTERRIEVSTLAALAAALIGLAASFASAIDYLGAAPTFCAETGCATVRASAWAHPLGVPMPAIGIAYFSIMAALALWPTPRPRLRRALAIAGAAWAVLLIALQAFVIGAWCKLCMIADPAAIALGVAVVAGAGTIRANASRIAATLPIVAAIVVGLRLFAHTSAPALPSGTPACVVREQQPGAVTVVEFVDFECPFCRALAGKLSDALAHAQQPVHVVRKMVPLPQHPHAMPAALAWCCAAAQGHGDQMAAALFAADPAELTPDGCEKIAARVGCDLDRYHRDLPLMVGKVAVDMLDARTGGIHGLPTVFIAGERLTGADHTAADLVAKIDGAIR